MISFFSFSKRITRAFVLILVPKIKLAKFGDFNTEQKWATFRINVDVGTSAQSNLRT